MPLRFKPKLDKIVELLLYLAHVRPGADKYQAVKLFYLADREHLIWYGRPITYERYCALSYGPVASTVLDLLNGDLSSLAGSGIADLPFRTEIAPAPNGNSTTVIREPLREVDKDLFSKTDLRVFDEIVAKYGNCSFGELFDLTHNHEAYKRAWDRRGPARSVEMDYAEMIEDERRRAQLVGDLLPIAANI